MHAKLKMALMHFLWHTNFYLEVWFTMTAVEIRFSTDNNLRILLKIEMRSGTSSALGNRHVKRRKRRKVYEDSNTFHS